MKYNETEFAADMVKLCPNLYSDLGGDKKKTAMFWGFEINYGWYPLVKDLSIKLEAEIMKLPEGDRGHCKASQIKEKFGSLRVYLTSETDAMYVLIEEAEKASAKICEQCGKSGSIRGGIWLICLCDECNREQMDNNIKSTITVK